MMLSNEVINAYQQLLHTCEAFSASDVSWLGMGKNIPNPYSYQQELLKLQKSRLDAYTKIGASIFPFPEGTKGILFLDDMPDPDLVHAFMHSKIPCFGGVWDDNEQVVVGQTWQVPYTIIVFDQEGKSQVIKGPDGKSLPTWEIPPFNDNTIEGYALVGEIYWGCCPAVHPISFYQVKHLVEILSDLSEEEIAEFVAGVTGMNNLNTPGVLTLKPSYGNNLAWSEVTFDFLSKTIKTTRELPQRLETFYTDIGAVNVNIAMALQAIEIAGFDADTSQRQIDAMLASRTQVFEEEDNYGAKMFSSEQLRVIRAHSVALMVIEDNWGEYPYFKLKDNNNPIGVNQCINWLVSQDRPFFVDKNGIKRVVVDQGVTALMVGHYEDTMVMLTANDKIGKIHVRPWQAFAIRALEGIPGMTGYRQYSSSALRIMNRNYPPE